jgi:peptide/nickel transport system substrate-binding protein
VVEFGMSGVYFNTRFEPFNDRIFRQALSLAFPIDDIIKIVLRGAGDPAGSIIAPSLEFWHKDSIPAFSYDPERAKELLLEAGYTWDEKGMLHYPTPENDKRDIDTGPHLY